MFSRKGAKGLSIKFSKLNKFTCLPYPIIFHNPMGKKFDGSANTVNHFGGELVGAAFVLAAPELGAAFVPAAVAVLVPAAAGAIATVMGAS